MGIIKTGNYRVVRQIIGQQSTREILLETQSLEDAKIFNNKIKVDLSHNDCYIKEEVYNSDFYINQQGNSLVNKPYWRRIES